MKIPDARGEGPLEWTESAVTLAYIFKSPSNASRGTFSVEVCSICVVFQALDASRAICLRVKNLS